MLKFKNSMKKIIFLLITAQMFSCDFSGKQTNSFNSTGEEGGKIIAPPNSYVNTAFGYSVPMLANLKLASAQGMQSLFFIDTQTEAKTDIIMVIPFTESLDEIAQQLQDAGTQYQRLKGGITFSVQQPGVANINASYVESPYGGGGIAGIRVITGESAIAGGTVNKLFSEMRFYPSQASFEEKNALLATDLESQKQSNREDAWIGMLRDQMSVCPF
jgi:hypothetical protein